MRGDGYNGNNNIKRGGIETEFTPEMVQEYIKCANDPIYFSEKYIKIVHVDHGLIPIKLYEYQREIMEKITKHRRVTVATSRQAGKTTTATAVILHYALFNSHKTIALLANKGDSAREILNRIKISYESLPKWLQQGVIEWNKGSVEFENGCKILAGSTSSDSIRGKSISFLYIDETAFVDNWEEFFASVFPTITSGKTTKILFTSTPNGLNHFYKTCEGAQKPKDDGWNGYHYIEVPWYKIPGRDEEWKNETLSGMDFDTQKFAQEFCVEFMGSSSTLIEGYKLKEMVDKIPIEEIELMKVYEKPIQDKIYCIIVDVSRGKGLDYSAFQIIDSTQMPYKIVASFRDNMVTPMDYAEIIFRAIKMYNDAYVLVEVNDIGAQIADLLHSEFEVDTLLFTESGGRAGKRISAGFGKSVDRGIRTTKSVKAIGCNMIKIMIEQDQLIVNDFHTISELSTFSRKGSSYEAESGKHDDLVMCLVLFGWLVDQPFFREITEIDTLKRLRTKKEQDEFEDILPIGFNTSDIMDTFENNFDHYSNRF